MKYRNVVLSVVLLVLFAPVGSVAGQSVSNTEQVNNHDPCQVSDIQFSGDVQLGGSFQGVSIGKFSLNSGDVMSIELSQQAIHPFPKCGGFIGDNCNALGICVT